MKTMILLGLAALVAVVLVFFMTGEFKNKFSAPDKYVNVFTRENIDYEDLGEGLHDKLYGDLRLGNRKGVVDSLYAQGGVYDKHAVPYGKSEDPKPTNKDKEITAASQVSVPEKEAATEKEAASDEVNPELSTASAGAHQRYHSPYNMKKSSIHKLPNHMKHLDEKHEAEEEKKLAILTGADQSLLSNHHTRLSPTSNKELVSLNIS